MDERHLTPAEREVLQEALLRSGEAVEAVPIAYHPSVFILQELIARRWTRARLAVRMGGDPMLNLCKLDLYLHVHDPRLMVGEETARQLGTAFGVSAEFFLNLEAAWRAHFAATTAAGEPAGDARD